MEWYGLHLNKASLKRGVDLDTPLTAMAFFLGAPQRWSKRKCTDREAKLFQDTLKTCPNLSSEQVVVHGCYLMNPASEREDVVLKSGPMFINELQVCEQMGVGKYVFHPGCSKDTQKGLQCTVDLVKAGLAETKDIQILVENMTQTNRLCQTWEECRWVLDHVNDPRLGFCMDTAHCWGAGKKKGMHMDTLLDDFDRVVGIDHLGAVHLNDSKVAYGANKDRHEDILVGQIPHSFWNSFIFDDRVKNIPAILETPSNCMPTVKMIIENGCVPNTEPKDSVKVKVVEKPARQSSQSTLNSFFVSTTGNEHETDVEQTNLEEKVKDVVSQDLVPTVTSFMEGYGYLENYLPMEWKISLSNELKSSYFTKLKQSLVEEEETGVRIYPPIKRTFRAFEHCKPLDIKVVIIGQDPYIRRGQAEGLSFSVPKGQKIPPSLRNIYKELADEFRYFKAPYHGHLVKWAEQGVMMLNASLTVREGKSNSHKDYGWQQFTDAVLRWINDHRNNVVFILMGKFAQKKCNFIDEKRHYVIKTAHPSPLARGFSGSKPFSKCNAYLREHKQPEIDWKNY